jgi:hypothetical protein
MLQTFWQQIVSTLGGFVPSFLGALGILIVGWLVAWLVSAVVRAALRRTNLDNRVAEWVAGKGDAKPMEVERWISKGVFYLIMLFVLVAFFQVLGLTAITGPLNSLLSQLFEYAPRLLAGGGLLLAAWLVASILRFLVSRGLGALKLDERLGRRAGMAEEKTAPISQTLSNIVYWLVFLLFLPAVLNALALQGLLGPVQEMMDGFLGFLPNLFGAALILVVGWFVARIVRQIVSNLLAAVGADRLSERVGLTKALGKQSLSGLLGLVVYVLILLPVLIAALGALKLDAITEPAMNMLDQILSALPALFGAALVLAISYVAGRVVSGLIANLLAGVGFDKVLAKMGLGKEPGEGQRTPSQVVGYLILVGLMLFASIEALNMMGFASVAELVNDFTAFAGQVILGLIIFAIGLYLANLATKTIEASGTGQAKLLALGARVSILVLSGAMALRRMGLANEIINLAFGLLIGAVAVALALSFGLGGRDKASLLLDKWTRAVESDGE